MGLRSKILFKLFLLLFILICYITFKYPLESINSLRAKQISYLHSSPSSPPILRKSSQRLKGNGINIWIIFTKASGNDGLTTKFTSLLQSIYKFYDHSNGSTLHFNILSDEASKFIAKSTFNFLDEQYKDIQRFVFVKFYDCNSSAEQIKDIIQAMTPHFSSQPGSYFSDALFFISLGLHRIAPVEQKKVILLDCDIIFKNSIEELYMEFKKFSSSNIFGIAHELSCVYRHVLHDYRLKHNGTHIGSPFRRKGSDFNSNSVIKTATKNEAMGSPGFNSGVLLLNLERIRESPVFDLLLAKESVFNITQKYLFKGHLGDQDFYTLLGFEYPELFHILDCGWNRQLCKWWRRPGEEPLFDSYYRCQPPIHIYHGNCNTHIPTVHGT